MISEVSSGKHASNSFQKSEAKIEPGPDVACSESTPLKVDHETSAKAAHFKQRVENFLLLFCCEDALNLYSLNEVPFFASVFGFTICTSTFHLVKHSYFRWTIILFER